MFSTTRASARRAGSLVAAFAVVLTTLLVTSPAQADPVEPPVTLTVNSTAITLGESITLSWSSTVAVDLVASGQWSGSKTTPAGVEVVTPTITGVLTYTLMATDQNGREFTDSVSVTVAPGPITPAPVTFPDPCTVVIPSTPNVSYFVDNGDDDPEELDADTYDGIDFSGGETVTFYAEANAGFTLADAAVTRWDYTAPESCLEFGPELVTTAVDCGSVTFTNTTDDALDVLFGSFQEEQADGEFTLAPGASRKIETSREAIVFIAYEGEGEQTQIRFLEVPQDCSDGDSGNGTGDDGDSGSGSGSDSDHPTVAPAAGIAAR